jgi:RND family efflux transporter MFP subunit
MNSTSNLTTAAPVPTGPRPLVPPQPATRFRLGLIAVVAFVVVAICAVAGLLPRWHQRGVLKAQTADLSVPFVSVASPTPEKAGPALSLPAEVKAFVEAPIYARASGYLKRWLVDIGAKVEAGQLLAEIDAPELNQELERSRAELAQADAALALAKITADRWKELLKSSSVSQQESAEKTSDLALKAATVEAARASVRRLEQLQSFERVVAPFAGTITDRQTDVGQLISATGNRPLFMLADLQKLRVYVRVPQSISLTVHEGQTASVTIPELPKRTFEAKVVRTSGAVSADSRTLLTELELDNSKGEILAGSYAQVRFTEADASSVLTLPATALLFRAEGPQVGVVMADNKVALRSISIGRDFGKSMEVLSGVEPTDRVILNPSDSLVSGAVVRIANPGN